MSQNKNYYLRSSESFGTYLLLNLQIVYIFHLLIILKKNLLLKMLRHIFLVKGNTKIMVFKEISYHFRTYHRLHILMTLVTIIKLNLG